MKESTAVALRRARRASQALFLALFLALLAAASYSGRMLDLAAEDPEAWTAVNTFLHFDPFAALGHLAAARFLPPLFYLSIATIAATLLLGRFFCGWVCPLGTIHHAAGACRRRPRALPAPWRRLKYGILVSLLAAAAFTILQPAILDPLCILARSCTLSLFPAVHFLVKRALIGAADSGVAGLAPAADGAYRFLESREFIGPHVFFSSALLTGAVFASLLLANLVVPRLWCRALCPLGALLGLVSRSPLLRIDVDRSRCTRCGACVRACPGGSLSMTGEGARHAPAECVLCLNCLRVCPEDAIGFSFLGLGDPSERRPDMTRRSLIAGLGAAAVAAPFLRSFRGTVNRAALIRPPGALPEDRFLAACLRCATCSRICPTGAIHPALAEAGAEGLWTPRLVPRVGYCVYDCTLCGQVCPSQAIRRLDPAGKRRTKLGTAVVDRDRCIAWATGMSCLACEEVCPVSPKAILADAMPGGPGRPVVDARACVGCGRCEHVCPIEGAAAIRVFAVGETRAR
ncbi:MAG: 4Fe-4S binding protein [bacterium]|nr:4Fe-4S binding protein [bacterium]